jgi:hypothetical protein
MHRVSNTYSTYVKDIQPANAPSGSPFVAQPNRKHKQQSSNRETERRRKAEKQRKGEKKRGGQSSVQKKKGPPFETHATKISTKKL